LAATEMYINVIKLAHTGVLLYTTAN